MIHRHLFICTRMLWNAEKLADDLGLHRGDWNWLPHDMPDKLRGLRHMTVLVHETDVSGEMGHMFLDRQAIVYHIGERRHEHRY